MKRKTQKLLPKLTGGTARWSMVFGKVFVRAKTFWLKKIEGKLQKLFSCLLPYKIPYETCRIKPSIEQVLSNCT